jgi:hypothetical protein
MTKNTAPRFVVVFLLLAVAACGGTCFDNLAKQ